MKKKLVCVLAALVALFGVFATSCGKTPESSNGGGDYDFNIPLDSTGKIVVWINAYEYEAKMMDAFVRSFNTRYPNITVDVQQITPAQYQATLKKASNIPGMLPDIYWVSPQYIGAYREMDIIMPLNDIMKADSSFDLSSVVEESLACCVQADDTWMLPRDFNQAVLYYNKDMFDAAGVEYPSATEAMSAEEFTDLMAELYANLKKSDEKNSYGEKYSDYVESAWDVCMTWDSLLWPLLKSFGAEVIRSDGTYMNGETPLLNSDETRAALSWALDLTQAHYIDGEQATHQDGLDFKLERSPMYSHMRCNFNDLITPSGQYKGIKNLGIAPFPNLGKQDNYYVGSGATGYAINKKTSNVVPAWLFLKSIVSEQSQEELSKTGYATPANKAVLDDKNAEWRKYTDAKIGEGYNEAFIYRRSDAYTHVNQFLSYIDYKYQDSVWFDMSTLYCQVTDMCQTMDDAETYLDLYTKRIAQYIGKGNK